MNQQQIGDQLQTLVNSSHKPAKGIHNVILGVSFPNAEFKWSGAAGLADPDTGSPMRAETPFLIASITKMYTAAAVMILQNCGRLVLSDRISKYLPGSLIQGLHHYRGKDYTDSLTIRHLISQTSGLPDYFLERSKNGRSVLDQLISEGDREWGLEDVIELTRNEFPAIFSPIAFENEGNRTRAKAHYSDTNYKLLGAIIESITEKPLHVVFKEFFFDPLNLKQTYLYGHPDKEITEAPAKVFYKDRPLIADKLMRSHGPEGGIVSTVDDTLRFGEAFMSGELFERKDTLTTMQRWNKMFFPLEYGYGIMRFNLPWLLAPFSYSPELIGHSGSSGSFLYYCPELNLYMTGTINQMTQRNMPFQLMIKIAQLFKRVA